MKVFNFLCLKWEAVLKHFFIGKSFIIVIMYVYRLWPLCDVIVWKMSSNRWVLKPVVYGERVNKHRERNHTNPTHVLRNKNKMVEHISRARSTFTERGLARMFYGWTYYHSNLMIWPLEGWLSHPSLTRLQKRSSFGPLASSPSTQPQRKYGLLSQPHSPRWLLRGLPVFHFGT